MYSFWRETGDDTLSTRAFFVLIHSRQTSDYTRLYRRSSLCAATTVEPNALGIGIPFSAGEEFPVFITASIMDLGSISVAPDTVRGRKWLGREDDRALLSSKTLIMYGPLYPPPSTLYNIMLSSEQAQI
jgi:hypothetical protein